MGTTWGTILVQWEVPSGSGNFLTNSGNAFAAGPSNTTARPTHGKSSFIDASQLFDDPDMPELEDITYSDDENDVGAEADFNNLETSITVSPILTARVHKDHPVSQIIGDLFLSQEEPKRVHQAIKDPSWIEAMQEKLLQFKMQKVWVLVDLPHGKRAIGTKWVYMNKKDERGIVVRNKARLVTQGHTQEDGVDYKEVFALVARIEAIRLFLAYASFMGFMVYQMNVKSAFLYGTIEEEVYALRVWYETLANYLLENGFQRGKIDQTLFIKKQKEDILLVQIYVDDIIFGAINKDLCKSFEKLMKDKFQMSSIGELTFFLGLQVKQKKDRIFISQDKYVAKILRKFGLTKGKSASTLIDTEKPLLKDPDGEDVDVHTYRSMIGSLMYLTSSRPDIMFACKKQTVVATSSTKAEYVAAASCYAFRINCWIMDASEGFTQIIDFLNGSYLKYALTVNPNIYVSCIKQFWNNVAIKQVNDITRLQAIVDKKKVVVTKAAIREVLRLDDAEGVDCLPNEESFTELARIGLAMASAVICLSTGRKFNFSKYIFDCLDKRLRKKEMQMKMLKMLPLVIILKEMILLLMEKFLLLLKNHPYHLLPQLFHHHNHLKISLQHLRYNKHHHNHLRRVEHLEYDKIAQALEITKLRRRVKKLEKGNKVRVLKLRKLQKFGTSQRVDTSDDTMMDDEYNQGRMIDDIDKDDSVVLMDEKEEDKKVEKAKVDESAQVQGRQAESQVEIFKIDMDHALKVLSIQEDEPTKVQEVVDVVTTSKLITKVVTAASETVIAASAIIFAAEPQVPAAIITAVPAKVAAAPKEPKPLKKKQHIKMDEEYARKLHAEINKDIDWDVAIDHVKLKAKEDPTEENRALQSINETPAQKAAKRRKLNEEVEDIKRHLEIMPDEDDDVYTKATPLTRKNSDREDLEALWSLVKERFSTSKPKNFSDDFLLTILGAMFEKPDVQAQVWKNQRTIHGQAKVKSWKLIESCDVHIITFTTTQLILLIERRYPLSRFTLDQMLNNVRLQFKEESEVSLELLRFTRQQHQEGQL
uniref:Reverse transcriptase Ty1/copia-type domain-containing protein n=1 Tax=Tanacetum cinerariifolium TaxID=118510 RepID=A0A6L2KP91_TANCI|nr:hypothetical protein [Tanacetum cinerariifolium]